MLDLEKVNTIKEIGRIKMLIEDIENHHIIVGDRYETEILLLGMRLLQSVNGVIRANSETFVYMDTDSIIIKPY